MAPISLACRAPQLQQRNIQPRNQDTAILASHKLETKYPQTAIFSSPPEIFDPVDVRDGNLLSDGCRSEFESP